MPRIEDRTFRLHFAFTLLRLSPITYGSRDISDSRLRLKVVALGGTDAVIANKILRSAKCFAFRRTGNELHRHRPHTEHLSYRSSVTTRSHRHDLRDAVRRKQKACRHLTQFSCMAGRRSLTWTHIPFVHDIDHRNTIGSMQLG